MEENSIQRRVWTPKEKDAVIAEITQENLELKRGSGDERPHEGTTQMNGQSRCTIYELLPEG